ncbi:MAG: FumA C-terminus/TtdB family hydratase beta subunit [Candidatus Omnitrophota bacterium]
MKWTIDFPVTDKNVMRKLKAGDEVFINGIIIGIRDASLMRIFDKKVTPPLDLKGGALLHTAPGVKKVGKKFHKVCIGTTTSTRMNRFTGGLLKQYDAKAIIGKAGLLQDSVEAMKKYGGCYLAITGGAAALETTQIEDIEEVHWEDLMPECLWKFKVKDFGPLIVAIDAHGTSLYDKVKKHAHKRLKKILER